MPKPPKADAQPSLFEAQPSQPIDYPTSQVVLPVDHRLIPGRRLFLDALAIPNPLR